MCLCWLECGLTARDRFLFESANNEEISCLVERIEDTSENSRVR